jgi:glycine C-acetyltransferase
VHNLHHCLNISSTARTAGAAELEGVLQEVDIINSTLGKALGGASGGFTTGRADVIATLRQRSRPYLFSNTVAPALVASASAALDILAASEDEDGKDPTAASACGAALRRQLDANTATFRARMTAAGFVLGGGRGDHPIVAVMLGDATLAAEMADRLLTQHGKGSTHGCDLLTLAHKLKLFIKIARRLNEFEASISHLPNTRL